MSLSRSEETASTVPPSPLSAAAVVWRGAVAGALGGIVALIFAEIFAEPVISAAIDYESARDDAQKELIKAAGGAVPDDGPDIFSRGVQSTVGIGTGMIFMGVALGLLFAVVYALLQGKISVWPRVLALLVAGAGFLTLYATPIVRYPANPPAIGHEDTIGDRSGLFLIMVVGSIIFLVVASIVAGRLRERLGTWNSVLVGIVVYVVLAGILMALLPSLGELSTNVANYGPALSETPQPLKDPAGRIVFPGFDADALYSFRLYSVAAQVLMWGILGLVFGALAERTGRRPDPASSATSTDSEAPERVDA